MPPSAIFISPLNNKIFNVSTMFPIFWRDILLFHTIPTMKMATLVHDGIHFHKEYFRNIWRLVSGDRMLHYRVRIWLEYYYNTINFGMIISIFISDPWSYLWALSNYGIIEIQLQHLTTANFCHSPIFIVGYSSLCR